ncbi:MAG: hypothetical protein D3X82_10305 [Candidatus Leucobacter sulfamidivorax]|nr:hypothetical protein [Candidatus Leucobacter sulfamidivorax]
MLAIVAEWPRVLHPEHRSVRVDGFLFLNPPLLLALSILCLVLGLARIPRVRDFNARHGEADRREVRRRLLVGEPWAPLLWVSSVVALIWVAWILGLCLFLTSPGVNPTGFWLLMQVLGLIAALWVSLLWVGLKRRAANRR